MIDIKTLGLQNLARDHYKYSFLIISQSAINQAWPNKE